jgi:hypothetical protein
VVSDDAAELNERPNFGSTVDQVFARSFLWVCGSAVLQKIKSQVGHDGLERIATDAVFEQLYLPPLKRTPEAAKRLKLLMVDLGWTPVRSRHVTSRGRAARVRSYARMRVSVEPYDIKP